MVENEARFAALDVLVWCLLVVTAIWLVATVYEQVLRRRHNLTRAETARRNKTLELDFLKKDAAAQNRALDAADAAARNLGEPAEDPPVSDTVSGFRHLFSVATGFVALITLLGVVASTIIRLDNVGDLIRRAGLVQLEGIIDQYPVGTSIAVLVIIYHVIAFFVFKKWKGRRA